MTNLDNQNLAPVIIQEIRKFSEMIKEQNDINNKEIVTANLFNYFISYHHDYEKCQEFINFFKKETQKDMQYFNNEIISKNLFNGFYEIESKKIFIKNIEELNEYLSEKIVINNDYIKTNLLFKEMLFCYNQNKAEFIHYYERLNHINVCINSDMLINYFFKNEKIDKKMIFIYDYFFKGHNKAKALTFLLKESEKSNTNKKIAYDSRLSYSLKGFTVEEYCMNIENLAYIDKSLKIFSDVKKNKTAKEMLISFIEKNIREKTLRSSGVYVQQIKSLKFNPFLYSMEVWDNVFENKYLIDMFDNEAVANKNMNFYNEKSLIENYLDNKFFLCNDKKNVIRFFKNTIIPFIKNISSDPFKDYYGTGCLFNDLIVIMDKYSIRENDKIEPEYIEIIEYYIERFSPTQIGLSNYNFVNAHWQGYIERKFLHLSINNQSSNKSGIKRL